MAKDTRKDSYKPTRTNAGHDIGGQGRDISSKIEAAQRRDAAGKGRC
jgi:hypothetical protein